MSKHLETCSNNLPTQLSSFIGREREVAELQRLLSTIRLLTLTGAGGAGKTRLALQVATNLLAEFEDGVCWVELAALTDPALVPQQVASSLGISEQPGHQLMDTLTGALQPRKLLLVLDNCEHLVAACAQLVETLLRSCPSLHILTTSREALNIAGETTWPVPSLRVPDAFHLPPMEGLVKYEAVHLFMERAASVSPFRPTQENAPALAHVCRRLDGIPLAIELAAARVKVLSVEQIATRLDDSYRLLAGGSRTALPRQQTLQATIDWSYNLLSEKERILFRRLSVFMGGFTLEAAEAICAGEDIEQDEVLDLLSHLVDKSLVMMEGRSDEARYRLLETIRQYGQDKLQEFRETATLRRSHRDWYLGLAERAESEMLGAGQAKWFNRLEMEHDNLRATLEWSLECGEAAKAAQIGAAIWRFWLLRGYLSEGRHWLERALAGYLDRTALRAKALHAEGILASHQGDYKRAKKAVEESLDLWRELADRQGAGAARLYGSAESLRDALGAPLTPTDRSYNEQTVAAVRTQLDESTFLKAWTEGRAMTLEQAIGTAKQVKAQEHITPASERTPAGTSPTSSSRGNSFSLTAREIEVLRLVTQGLTYAQIAEQLIISPRTADAHLRSIYGKLGVTSRSAATRIAIEHRLV